MYPNLPYKGANDTILYKQAVGTYEEWSTTEQAEDVKTRLPSTLTTSQNLQMLYQLLLREYRNWEIAFDSVDAFLDKYWTVIEVEFPNYMERKTRYEQLLALSDSDLLALETRIHNFVENTNERYEAPLSAPLPNITNQDSDITYADRLSRIRQKIQASKMDILHDFLNRFRWLFIRLTTRSIYISI